MKTLFLAVPRNESRHLPRMLMAGVNSAISDDSAKIRAIDTTFRLEVPVALKQLDA
jgi:hypothetical protein